MGHKVEMTPEKAALYQKHLAPVIRTWKRDGHKNVMSFEQAVANLADNATDYPKNMLRAEVRSDVARRLLAGQVVETKHARFQLACASEGPTTTRPAATSR